MKQVICLSTRAWSSTPGRTQQLVSRIRDVQVLYFSPAAGLLDLSYRQKGKTVRPGVTAYTLPPTLTEPGGKRSLLFQASQRRLGRFVEKIAARHRFHRSLLWTTCPSQAHLMEYLQFDSLVYDCDQEWDDLDPLLEGELAHRADLLLCASPGLRERLSPCSANIAVVENGANSPLFSSIAQSPISPSQPPTLGWAGTIHEDLDLTPLLFAARTRPDWNFILLGARDPSNPALPRLKQLPNVRFLRRCPLVEVPEYLASCHVLMDFQRHSQAGSDVVPPRMYEYLCTGKPVVSMILPDQVERFPDMVYAAHSPEEFVLLCQNALEESPGWVSGRRQSFGTSSSWNERADRINRILNIAGLI